MNTWAASPTDVVRKINIKPEIKLKIRSRIFRPNLPTSGKWLLVSARLDHVDFLDCGEGEQGKIFCTKTSANKIIDLARPDESFMEFYLDKSNGNSGYRLNKLAPR